MMCAVATGGVGCTRGEFGGYSWRESMGWNQDLVNWDGT